MGLIFNFQKSNMQKQKYHNWTTGELKMITSGMKSQEIAEKIGIPITAVYSKKAELSRKGKGFSSVVASTELSAGQKAARTRRLNKSGIKIPTAIPLQKPLKFIINGVSLSIDGDIKNVLVSRERISIEY